MFYFVLLIYLLSICSGYCAAYDSWSNALWNSVGHGEVSGSYKTFLKPGWQRISSCVTCLVSLIAICYAFWNYGFIPGIVTLFCFAIAVKMAALFLRQRIHGMFHLNLALKSLEREQVAKFKAKDLAGVRALEAISDKVAIELYAIKVVKSAQQVPCYEGSTLYLSIKGAKADNYHCSHKSGKER